MTTLPKFAEQYARSLYKPGTRQYREEMAWFVGTLVGNVAEDIYHDLADVDGPPESSDSYWYDWLSPVGGAPPSCKLSLGALHQEMLIASGGGFQSIHDLDGAPDVEPGVAPGDWSKLINGILSIEPGPSSPVSPRCTV